MNADDYTRAIAEHDQCVAEVMTRMRQCFENDSRRIIHMLHKVLKRMARHKRLGDRTDDLAFDMAMLGYMQIFENAKEWEHP